MRGEDTAAYVYRNPGPIQGDQINMAVLFWYPVKVALVYATVHWTSQVLQGTKTTRPCITGHPVWDFFCEGYRLFLPLSSTRVFGVVPFIHVYRYFSKARHIAHRLKV